MEEIPLPTYRLSFVHFHLIFAHHSSHFHGVWIASFADLATGSGFFTSFRVLVVSLGVHRVSPPLQTGIICLNLDGQLFCPLFSLCDADMP